MIYVKSLCKALEDWDNQIGEERLTDLSGIVSVILLQLGSDSYKNEDYNENPLKYLENRLAYIKNSVGIFEEFLVEGAITLLTNYFSEQLSKREELIKSNERLLIDAEKIELDAPFIGATKAKIDVFKSDTYPILCLKELKAWEESLGQHFSKEKRDEMANEKALEAMSEYKKSLSPEQLQQFIHIKEKLK